MITGCDVRKKDKVAGFQPLKRDLKDPTSVKLLDTIFDFGKIKEGEKVDHSFRFINTGTHALVISSAAASCGCTVAEKPEAPIQPGDTGIIKARFNSDKKPGEAHKTITVTSNADPEFPPLLIKGTVIGKGD
jgi:hypothetical protein